MTSPDFQFLRTEPVDLKRYLPVFLYLSPEFKAIQDALGKEHERQRQVQIDVARQFKAETATWGMAAWERMLGINVDTTVDLETRRDAIISKLNTNISSTKGFLEGIINTHAVGHIEEMNAEYCFRVLIDACGQPAFEKIFNALNMYKPAHLGTKYEITTRPVAVVKLAMAKRIRLKTVIHPTTVSTESGTGTIYAGGVQAITETINYVQGAD